MRMCHPRRGGFTLVELLVGIGLILILTALAVGVAYSGILDNHKMVAGTDRVSSWLMQARGKAARDQAPRGVRFIIDSTGTKCTEAQFIEVPDPYNPNPNGSATGYRLVFLRQQGQPTQVHVVVSGANAAAITASLNAFRNEVSIGDVLSAPEFTSIHRITGVSAVVNTLRQLANPNAPYQAGTNEYQPVLSVQLSVTNTILLPDLGGLFNPYPPGMGDPPGKESVPNYSTTTFGFLRQPRPTLGEPALQLSASTVIDISPNGTVPTTIHDTAYLPDGPDADTLPDLNPNGVIDVLFAPNGEVLNASQGKIILWVRNPEFPHPRTSGDARVNYEAAGEMSLIVVYTKTGSVSTQPVNIPAGAGPANPHAYANDGINSGL